jgi:hypothetical protein
MSTPEERALQRTREHVGAYDVGMSLGHCTACGGEALRGPSGAWFHLEPERCTAIGSTSGRVLTRVGRVRDARFTTEQLDAQLRGTLFYRRALLAERFADLIDDVCERFASVQWLMLFLALLFLVLAVASLLSGVYA